MADPYLPSRWLHVLDQIERDSASAEMTDIDAECAWRLGLAAWREAHRRDARWPHEGIGTAPPPPPSPRATVASVPPRLLPFADAGFPWRSWASTSLAVTLAVLGIASANLVILRDMQLTNHGRPAMPLRP